jgi:hypothetical protein
MHEPTTIISHLLIDDVLPLVRTYCRPTHPMVYALQCHFSWEHNAEVAEEASTIAYNRIVSPDWTIRELIAEQEQ